ncbi:MAG: diadenylate cyclase CdaA [Anaerolineae bacterium]|nr:diadenylate cyclase CdaA [Thermoflexus sp.]MDW8064536.1 diadenylate cyclase CdaA [Anaerolineae bacterium]
MRDLIYLLDQLNWISLIDIGLVALLLFGILYSLRGTPAITLIRGLFILFMLVLILSGPLSSFRAMRWLLGRVLPALLIAIPIIFQPELRRALERLGRFRLWLQQDTQEARSTEVIQALVQACPRLAERRHGALIVLERTTGLENYIETGIRLDARVTPELLMTIFAPNTILHDGAVIIRDGRIVAAGCILPLTTGWVGDPQLGLRHRAAIGITEVSDALAIVISEERGTISVVLNGRIVRRLDARRLELVLRNFYSPPPEVARTERWLRELRDLGRRAWVLFFPQHGGRS